MKIREATKDGKHYSWIFHCPACDDLHQFDERWTMTGTVDSPTFKPSLLVNGTAKYINPAMPRCHLYVTNGIIEFLKDCSHKMAGMTIPMANINPED